MTHPEIVDHNGDRRLKCPAPGCEELLSEQAKVRIASGDERGERRLICFDWDCPGCGKRTELVVDPREDGCWTLEWELIPSAPDGAWR